MLRHERLDMAVRMYTGIICDYPGRRIRGGPSSSLLNGIYVQVSCIGAKWSW